MNNDSSPTLYMAVRCVCVGKDERSPSRESQNLLTTNTRVHHSVRIVIHTHCLQSENIIFLIHSKGATCFLWGMPSVLITLLSTPASVLHCPNSAFTKTTSGTAWEISKRQIVLPALQ